MSTNPSQTSKRPVAIAIIGWILVLGALVNIFVGAATVYLNDQVARGLFDVALVLEDDPNEFLTDAGDKLVLAIYSIVVGLVQLVLAVGFWREKRWAWVAAMSWQALKLLIEVASTFAGGGNFITMIFSIALVYMLNQNTVRRIFNIRPPENESFSVKTLNSFDSN